MAKGHKTVNKTAEGSISTRENEIFYKILKTASLSVCLVINALRIRQKMGDGSVLTLGFLVPSPYPDIRRVQRKAKKTVHLYISLNQILIENYLKHIYFKINYHFSTPQVKHKAEWANNSCIYLS